MALAINWIEVNPSSTGIVLGEIPYLDLGTLTYPNGSSSAVNSNLHAFKLQVQGSSIMGSPAPNPASQTTPVISLRLVSQNANVYSYTDTNPSVTIQQPLGSGGLGLGVYACLLPVASGWETGDFSLWTNLLTNVLTVSTIPIVMNNQFTVETPPIGFVIAVPAGFTETCALRNMRLRINFSTYDESNPSYVY